MGIETLSLTPLQPAPRGCLSVFPHDQVCSRGDRNVAVDLRGCDWDRLRLLLGLRVYKAFVFPTWVRQRARVQRSRQISRSLFAVGISVVESGRSRFRVMDASRRPARGG